MTKKLIGKGVFSRVYDNNDGTVSVLTCDPLKNCYSIFPNDLTPEILDYEYLGDNMYLLQMPKYTKVTSPKKQLNSHSYELYQWLRQAKPTNNTYNTLFPYFENCPFDKYKEDLQDLLSSIINYEYCELGFEISPRNIAVKDRGDIVLLDLFFSKKVLLSTIKEKPFNSSMGKYYMKMARTF